MNVKNILILCSLFLSGCLPFFNNVDPVNVVTTCEPKIPLALNEADPINSRYLEWYVITKENYQEVFQRLTDENVDVVLYGLTDEGYQALSLNLAEIRKYIIEERAIIKAYKDYYEKDQNTGQEH